MNIHVGESCSVANEVRLVNSSETSEYIEGRVEICYNGQWTPICRNTYISRVTGGTLCNSLGRTDIVKGCKL